VLLMGHTAAALRPLEERLHMVRALDSDVRRVVRHL
jgi:hypothetical protein